MAYAIGFTSRASPPTVSAIQLAETIASALSRDVLTRTSIEAAFFEALGRKARFAAHCAARLVAALGEGRRVRTILIRRALLADRGFRRAHETMAEAGRALAPLAAKPQTMSPARGFGQAAALPVILDLGSLARWLHVPLERLLWLADQRTLEARPRDPRLRRYTYRWIQKRGGDARLLEAPKRPLKAIQRRIARDILRLLPPHDAAHGFRQGRDIIGFAAPHAGRPFVLRVDLADFFPTISSSIILSIFLTAGYPERVARALTGLCVNTAPSEVIHASPVAPLRVDRRFALRRLYGSPHLPQGAPSSPALANLALFRVDRRLTALAKAFGATYTRYADDLVFSGPEDFARRAARFLVRVEEIVEDRGLVLNQRKTRRARAATAQRIAGLVVNARPNVPRKAREKLEAILYNAVRSGPASQNRAGVPDFRAHLRGRIAHVAHVNRAHAAPLWALFERIDWTSPASRSADQDTAPRA